MVRSGASGAACRGVIPGGDVGFYRYLERANAIADQVGEPEVEIKRVTSATAVAPTNTGLSSVLAEWRRLKKAGNKGRETSHIKGVTRIFSQFVKVVGDVPINALASAHFRAWREWVLHEAPKRESGKWSNDRHATVKMVLRFVRRHNDDWPWPAGLSDWLEAYERKAYQSRPDNRQLLPVAAFHRLVKATELWAGVEPVAFDPHTQRGRGQRRQAVARQQNGVRFRAVLMLGVNCGLDPCDIPRITRESLKMDAVVPCLDLPRPKVEHRVGAAVARKTPLLPSTIAALREVTARAPSTGPVFRSSRGTPFTTVTHTFRRLADEAGVDRRWSYKHGRNVGPSIAKRAKLPRDEREAFLGHVVDGTSKFYEADVDETFLVDLVNLIGEQYFGGERVGSDRRLTLR
ncbi:MAG: hypothetical protein ACYSVY_28965 [Planctomycetota bacterium]